MRNDIFFGDSFYQIKGAGIINFHDFLNYKLTFGIDGLTFEIKFLSKIKLLVDSC